MAATSLGTCSTCVYWDLINGPQGRCRVLPPPLPPVAHAGTIWPITQADDWCGRWAASPGNEPPPACREIGRYLGTVNWTLTATNVWTPTPIYTPVTCTGDLRCHIQFSTLMGIPNKGSRVFWTITIDDRLPVGDFALGAMDAPEANYGVMAVGAYYITPEAGSHIVALSVYGPAGAQIFDAIASVLYVTEEHP